jgi:hypothetical protein
MADKNGGKSRKQSGTTRAKKLPHVEAEVERRLGRKPGKHSDKSYTQTSIYLPIELKNKVRAKLYEKGVEMSGLVEAMLRDWLAKQS